MSEPTPVRVTYAGENFTCRLLSAPNAIHLVEISSRDGKRFVPARWCEPLNKAAQDLLEGGDRFVGAPKKDAAVVLERWEPAKQTPLPDLKEWTLQEVQLLREFVFFEANKKTNAGHQASGWMHTYRLLKAALKERRMTEVLDRGGITPEQARDPDHLIKRARDLVYILKAELWNATHRHIYGDLLPAELEGIDNALNYYADHYRKMGT